MDWKDTAARWGEAIRTSLRRYRLVWLAILAGLVLLAVPTGEGKEQAPSQPIPAVAFDLKETEARLSETLSQIEGAGDVTVMLTLRDGPRKVLAQDSQQGEGDARCSTVVLSAGNGTQETVTVQELYPGYQGALLVCPGGDDPQIRLKLTQAVSALTGLGADRIAISKGK